MAPAGPNRRVPTVSCDAPVVPLSSPTLSTNLGYKTAQDAKNPAFGQAAQKAACYRMLRTIPPSTWIVTPVT